MGSTGLAQLKSANLQAGIDYEIERERVGMLIAKKIHSMAQDNGLLNPSDADIAELRALESRRGNGR